MKRIVFLALFAAASAFAAETKEANTGSAPAKQITLGLAIPYFGQEFWATVQKGAEDAAAKAGVQLVVAESYNDPAKQTAQVESFIASKVAGILLPPANPQALAPVVQEANQADIPVIGVDTKVAGGKETSFVASDNITVGEIAGKYIVDRLNGKGNVFIGTWPQNQSTLDRVVGLKNVLSKNPDIKIVAEQVAKLPPDTTAQAEDVFTAYTNIDAFFGIADVQTLPFWKVAKERGINNKIFFVGVDATKEGLAAVAENSGYAATVAQQPYDMGRIAVETALAIANGQKVEEYIEVPVTLVTLKNLKEFVK
jgi:ribose transport system substrate-binding protein